MITLTTDPARRSLFKMLRECVLRSRAQRVFAKRVRTIDQAQIERSPVYASLWCERSLLDVSPTTRERKNGQMNDEPCSVDEVVIPMPTRRHFPMRNLVSDGRPTCEIEEKIDLVIYLGGMICSSNARQG